MIDADINQLHNPHRRHWDYDNTIYKTPQVDRLTLDTESGINYAP